MQTTTVVVSSAVATLLSRLAIAIGRIVSVITNKRQISVVIPLLAILLLI